MPSTILAFNHLRSKFPPTLAACFVSIALGSTTVGHAQPLDSSLSFFITGRSLGTGGNFGGLAGADAHCQQLADSVGAGNRVWRAYLSTQAVGEIPAVNARDRIGAGPWFNANRVMVAANLTALHDTANRTTINATNGLTHRGAAVASNLHDLVTGTKFNGMAPIEGADSTCGNWTSSTTGGAIVGHHNRQGISSNICQSCWSQAHRTGGCTQTNLQQGGGAGYFYCFAADAPGTAVTPPSLRGERIAAEGVQRRVAPYLLSPTPRITEVVYRFALESPANVDVSVHDADGRRRTRLMSGLRLAGEHAVSWDGRDSRGDELRAGLYFIVLSRSAPQGR
jgi:hypothetical protein